MMPLMAMLAIFAGRALTPLEEIRDAVLVVEDGVIRAIGSRDAVTVPAGARRLEARSATLVPGFVDVHIHGAGGHDVMDASEAALRTVAQTVARFGATSLVATTVTAPLDRTCRSVEAMARCIRAGQSPGAAEILGVHFEGPFLSRIRCGAQPAEWLQPPSVASLEKMLDAAQGTARLLTLAPELPGALEVIDAARQRGLVVSLGHTDATYAEARAAIERGARHAAHVFNAMRPFSHRETGVLGAVLTDPRVTAELIADGVHVDPAAMQLLLAAKGAAGVVLVSDATAATAMPDGTYRLGTFEVIMKGGVCRTAQGNLAGSTLTLDRALRNIVALGTPLRDAVAMLTLHPARVLGLEKKKGALLPGADADLVLLDEGLLLHRVFTRGIEISA
jgi:N-acetylglucosamine-6-phosphate deacetylase